MAMEVEVIAKTSQSVVWSPTGRTATMIAKRVMRKQTARVARRA
jgi:hypothetical protein